MYSGQFDQLTTLSLSDLSSAARSSDDFGACASVPQAASRAASADGARAAEQGPPAQGAAEQGQRERGQIAVHGGASSQRGAARRSVRDGMPAATPAARPCHLLASDPESVLRVRPKADSHSSEPR